MPIQRLHLDIPNRHLKLISYTANIMNTLMLVNSNTKFQLYKLKFFGVKFESSLNLSPYLLGNSVGSIFKGCLQFSALHHL